MSFLLRPKKGREGFLMRFAVPMAILLISGTSAIPTPASSMDDKNFDQRAICQRRLKIRYFAGRKFPPPTGDEGLQFQPVGVKMKPAAEAEAGSGGDRPAEE